MTEATKETYIRTIVVDIQKKNNSFVVDEIMTTDELVMETLECYMDLSKYRIITV